LTQFDSFGKIRVSGAKVERCLWPRDLRLGDVRCMLQSDAPVPVSVQQRFNMTDHEFLEEQERQLLTLCVRTMALPVGRGEPASSDLHPNL
jgi:anaphase-promoting complex subunit 1